MKCYPDILAYRIFMAGYSFEETATMLTGAQPGTPEHHAADLDVQDSVRTIVLQNEPQIDADEVQS
jgi:hypothetical protein